MSRLNQTVNAAMQASEYRKTFESRGTKVFGPMNLDTLNHFYASEIARYQGLAKSINITPQ